MKHLTALLIKWAYIEAIVLAVLIPTTDAGAGQATVVALATTLLLYAAGDLMVLPTLGNISAVMGDAGLALLTVWAAPLYSGVMEVGFVTALTIAAIIAAVEYIFHQYLLNTVIEA